MPPSLTTRSHFFISLSMKVANSTELICTVCAPSLAKYFFTSSEFCTAVISVCSLSTIAAGVPAAAAMLEAADAGRGILQLARLLLGGGQQLLDRMHRQLRIDDQDIGAGGENG